MASKRHLRRKACESKEKYDEATAKRFAGNMTAQQGKVVLAYKCPFGNHWHTGHATRRQRQGLEAKGLAIR